MSFKWKWLLTTFVAQLLLGGIFTTIQYIHMSKLAEQDLLRIQESFKSELTKAHLANNSHSLNVLSSIVRDFYSRHKPAAVWVNATLVPRSGCVSAAPLAAAASASVTAGSGS